MIYKQKEAYSTPNNMTEEETYSTYKKHRILINPI